jgi:hypothetical protein
MIVQFMGSWQGQATFKVQIDEGMLDGLGSDCGYVEAFWRAADEYLKLTRQGSLYGETPEAMKAWVISRIQAFIATLDPEKRWDLLYWYEHIIADIRNGWDEAFKRIQNGSVPSLGLPGGPRVLEAEEDTPLSLQLIASETKGILKQVALDPVSELILIADGLDAAMNSRLADKIRAIALNLGPNPSQSGSDVKILHSDDDGNLFNSDGSRYSPYEVPCPLVSDQAVS